MMLGTLANILGVDNSEIVRNCMATQVNSYRARIKLVVFLRVKKQDCPVAESEASLMGGCTV